VRLVALAALHLAACKVYDVHVVLTPAAEDRRLASGKSDTIKGRLESADAASLYAPTARSRPSRAAMSCASTSGSPSATSGTARSVPPSVPRW
jgi:hypothetical protein